MSFFESIAVTAGVNLIAALGIYLLTGLTGLFSFGQAGFMATGAYVSAVVALKLGLPYYVAIPVGILASALTAFATGYPTIRLRSNYFAIATLGFSEAIRSLLNFFVSFTGGATGVGGIPRRVGIWTVLLFAAMALVLVRNFVCSKLGRASVAVRTDEMAAESMGMDSFKVRMLAYIFASCLAGLAGGLMAFYMSYIAPDMFSVARSVELLVIVFFGGLRSMTGAVIAAILLTAVPQLLHFAAEWRAVLFSVLVLTVIIYKPEGLMGSSELTFGHFARIRMALFGKRRTAKDAIS
ncbi:MAG: branched-chain amino acid ABC transporter permease [Bacillota bacterium]|nr:branched-chain amino acid ABC transporter permease [Bacillota bacterium]